MVYKKTDEVIKALESLTEDIALEHLLKNAFIISEFSYGVKQFEKYKINFENNVIYSIDKEFSFLKENFNNILELVPDVEFTYSYDTFTDTCMGKVFIVDQEIDDEHYITEKAFCVNSIGHWSIITRNSKYGNNWDLEKTVSEYDFLDYLNTVSMAI